MLTLFSHVFKCCVQEYCSSEISKWSSEKHMQKLVRQINSVQRKNFNFV
jgi:hypothetical protein